MVCYRCFGDKLCGANGPIDDQTSEQENLALANQASKKPQNAEKGKILHDCLLNQVSLQTDNTPIADITLFSEKIFSSYSPVLTGWKQSTVVIFLFFS